MIKTCITCAHHNKGKCALSGSYAETERKYPYKCGVDFRGWRERPKKIGFKKWLEQLWYGEN